MEGGAPTVGAALARAVAAIGGDSPRIDAELLLCAVIACSRSWLFAHSADRLDPGAAARFEALWRRRAAGEPVAYLLGRRGFWSLDLEVGPSTLIPRPETELLVSTALGLLDVDATVAVADLGTGSGAVALALATERPRLRVVAVERDPAALRVAARNLARAALGNVELRLGDWYRPLAGERYALLVSNPPYVAENDVHLTRGDLRHEPRDALVGGRDGLDAIRALARGAPAHLEPGGWLIVEHGHRQGEAIRALFAAAGLVEVSTLSDLGARERVSRGRLPSGRGDR